MQLSHESWKVTARFDEANLVSCAGLVAVAALAERAGLSTLLERLTVPVPHAVAKLIAVVLGMVAGADSIIDLDLLRHGGMRRLFAGIRAPSTLGTFLRAFTFGHVRQLDAVAARLLAALVTRTPLLPGRDRITYLDIDDTVRETHGYAKQGAGRGYTGVKGLNVLLATLSTPGRTGGSVPLIAAARLREGAASSVRGAWKLVADALAVARRCQCRALVIVRADSAYYAHAVVATAARAGARFSVTVRHTPSVLGAIAGIDEQAWIPIRYPRSVWDDQDGRWVSEAEVAEIPFTAFTGRRRDEHVHARLIVRRVRRLNPATAPAGHRAQGELFAAYRYHAVFTDSPLATLEAEAAHRDHAIIEQVIADLKNSALAHLPLRAVLGQRRVAGRRGDGLQPHPRRRRPGRGAAREGAQRHPAPHPDQRRRPHLQLRATSRTAPAARLALGVRARCPVPPRDARPPHPRPRLTVHPPQGRVRNKPWKGRADRRTLPTLTPNTTAKDQSTDHPELRRSSRPGARCRDCSRSVSPGRSPNPACASRRTGLSTVAAVMRAGPRGWGCCCLSIGSGSRGPLRG